MCANKKDGTLTNVVRTKIVKLNKFWGHRTVGVSRGNLSGVLALVLALGSGCQAAAQDTDGRASPGFVGMLSESYEKAARALRAKQDARTQELRDVQRTLQATSAQKQKVQTEIEALIKDHAGLNRKLIATAAGMQDIEAQLSQSERRLHELNIQEHMLHKSLYSRRDTLMALLAALQRIGRRPPPAILISPEDALNSVRSAMLVGNTVPELRADLRRVGNDLTALAGVRRSIRDQHKNMREQLGRYGEQQQRISLLMKTKQRYLQQSESTFRQQQRRSEALARRAATLSELITTIEEDVDAAAEAARQARQAEQLAALTPGPSLFEEPEGTTLSNLGDPARKTPHIPFSQAKGRLALPVKGAFLRKFGEPDQLGERSLGEAIMTPHNATIVAPSDGWVVFAAPFRSYGKLLIINAGGGYHVLLAGMERIDVPIGRFVQAGEPVGQMGTQRYASNAADLDLAQPILYIEFRKNDVSIDPSPWWERTQTVKVDG